MPFQRSVKPSIARAATRIAIDARTVLKAKTGDRTYTLNLLCGLQQIEASWRGEFAFDLLLDAPDTTQLLPQSAGFATHILAAKNSRLWTLCALPKWANQHRPDLVHVHYLRPGAIPCPFVSTIHDVVWRVLPRTFPAFDRAVMNLLMPLSARGARRILTVSQSSKAGIARTLRVSPQKIDVTPNAVDARFFEAVSSSQIESLRAKYGLGSALYILSVGVLQPRKNVPRLISAFEKLQKERADFPFQLVVTGKPGWGDDADLARKHPNVRFTGYVLDEELPALYAGATVFAYPSLYEGFGLPVIEAMAAGCPVLTSNRSSLPEISGDAAIKIDPYRTDAIAQGLALLLDDEALRTELSGRGKVWAARFTTQNQAQETLKSYRRALRNP
ncbi:Glycosyltransferase involved in cell wall bisynthesis [Abditibacterium utsteinense]|uniref:Glycosyltransferase involved in cell wall bisynthesis n=1 Tax=Abditibacterium utsteinense TaxID=1960156 RepID=A0A2S8SPY8_9BACT|nr:glycosyltransferase family 1 protein [Abditibacterium utsteinense]PQV62861.1 Glycosyltransferase involved in cell wall bisynthesis [Abditibacterium utsteinense]